MRTIQITTNKREFERYQKFREKNHFGRVLNTKVTLMALGLVLIFFGVRLGDIPTDKVACPEILTSDMFVLTASSWIFVIGGVCALMGALLVSKIFKFKKDKVRERDEKNRKTNSS